MARNRSHVVRQIDTLRMLVQELNALNLKRFSQEFDARLSDMLQSIQRTPRVEVSHIRLAEAIGALTRSVRRDASEPLEGKVNAAVHVALKRLDDFEDALTTAAPVQDESRRHQESA